MTFDTQTRMLTSIRTCRKPKAVLLEALSIKILTIRQRANGHIVSGDPRPVLVVGHHTETVLCVLLQACHGVGLNVNVNVLKEKEGGKRRKFV